MIQKLGNSENTTDVNRRDVASKSLANSPVDGFNSFVSLILYEYWRVKQPISMDPRPAFNYDVGLGGEFALAQLAVVEISPQSFHSVAVALFSALHESSGYSEVDFQVSVRLGELKELWDGGSESAADFVSNPVDGPHLKCFISEKSRRPYLLQKLQRTK